ncbi:MAG TPA: alkaline phosphatase D family protein [Nitrososphaeraceae archaeon]|nr:alkaline phosphatase D family protein [Nitrososphaeraceae archaeon]
MSKVHNIIYKKFFSLTALIVICTFVSISLLGIFSVNAIQDIQFTSGVASGNVTSDSAVLWTRINQDGVVEVEVSNSPTFKKIVFSQSVPAIKENDFTVKVMATGLQENHKYYYRWIFDNVISETGTFITSTISSDKKIHFAWSGDSDPSKNSTGHLIFGDWKVLDAARLESPTQQLQSKTGLDFFIYLGDTIYSDFRGFGKLPAAQTLDEFRQIYKDARNIPALNNLLKSTSIYPIWDDHEVRNDWDGQTVDPEFYFIGNKSFHEYMPIQQSTIFPPEEENCAGPPQFKVVKWGKNLVDLIFIDTRSCRSASVENICRGDLAPTLPSEYRQRYPPFILPTSPPPGCLEAINDSNRTMLGNTQKEEFKKALINSDAKFKFIVSPAAIQQTYGNPYDEWEGYGAERSEILNFIRDNKINNVIFITTDKHLSLINEVFIDSFTDPRPIANEIITGPIASLTDQEILENSFPPSISSILVQARHDLLDIVGADCRHIDKFSYGSVEVNPDKGSVKITIKDENGNVIHDQKDPSKLCEKTFVGISQTLDNSIPSTTNNNKESEERMTKEIPTMIFPSSVF